MSIFWDCVEVLGEMVAVILIIALAIFALWWGSK